MSHRSEPVIMWFREDLRLADNPALGAAVENGSPVIPLFILDQAAPSLRTMGAASRWWLHHSLQALSHSLASRGSRLILRSGRSLSQMEDIVRETGATRIVWNRRYGKAERELDAGLKERFRDQGLMADSFNGKLLREPWEITNKSGQPFRVFTPFWKTCLANMEVAKPLAAPDELPLGDNSIRSEKLSDWSLRPEAPDWATGFWDVWQPGEAGAAEKLETFTSERLGIYANNRDLPSVAATSCLSPHLAFGEISPRQIWWAVQSPEIDGGDDNVRKYLSEIGWREFAYHILFHNPDLATDNFQDRFDKFPWREPDESLAAWQHGKTGYPIVDASMRQLWLTGWMHNRCRMIVGSFLTKHLLLDWRLGESWFWDTLVDADQANNPAGWQWIAGTGADAAPYFRVFNPILQSRKFDPDGTYIRTFCPELKNLNNDQIHEPWTVPEHDLEAAGVRLGHDYPHPIVGAKAGRDRALAAYSALSGKGQD